MRIDELREKVKNSMIEHLQTVGYPNMEVDDVLQELKPMWVKLENEGLIQSGMNFRTFQEWAVQKAMEAQITDHIFGRKR